MIDLGFTQIDGVVFFALVFGVLSALAQTLVSFFAKRFIGRITPIILLLLGALALVVCAFIFEGWSAVGYFLLAAYLAALVALCVLICIVCSIIRCCIK